MREKTRRIAVTAGDPAGIGPEVALKALAHCSSSIIPILICREDFLRAQYSSLLSALPKITVIPQNGPFPSLTPGTIYLYNEASSLPLPSPGRGNCDTGRESLAYIDRALSIWQDGHVDAIVTGPVNKGLIEESGTPFTGHTEYMARYIGEEGPVMLMFSDKYRVALATTHLPLRDVTTAIDEPLLYRIIKTVNRSFSTMEKGKPRLAITGLDPHCGDAGAIGDFDMSITRKAVERMKKEGIDIEGPFAADTLFVPDKWAHYSCIIAHYHDQGLIPFKMIAFDTGVNVTLGLSLVRTSVDHGTAYDIAGTGAASFQSMVSAINLAERLAGGRVDKGPVSTI